MEKRTVIVTGGNSGLGYQCAKNIAMKDKDYTLVLACRNPEKAAKAIQDTRIVKLRDGKIIDDSNPFLPEEVFEEAAHKSMGKAKCLS